LAARRWCFNFNLETVGEKEFTIKDETVTFTIRESKTASGALRQMSGVFPGKHGPVMLMISGAVKQWDDEVVEGFIASLR
jgi:hypothetical protein